MKAKPTRQVRGKALKQPRFNDEVWPKPTTPSGPSKEIEMLARMWIACDPNRDSEDMDEPIGQSCTGGSDEETVCTDTPLTGKPRWHWFIPRAEASLEFFKANGFALRTSQDTGEPTNG